MDEYIERDGLISDIDAAMENAGMGYVVGQTLKRYVKRQTAADVAPVRHGRWIWQTESVYKCSNCGDDAHVKEVMGKPSFDYCPNCGAKMDLEET